MFLKNLNPIRRIRELVEELARTRRERDQARKETEHRQEEIERLQEENQQLQKENQRFQKENQRLQKENQRLQKENQQLRKDLEARSVPPSVRPLPSHAGSPNPIPNVPGVSLGRRMVPTLTGRSPIT